MTRKKSGLSIIAFFISIICLGLSGYVFYQSISTTTKTQVQQDRVWYDYEDYWITESASLANPTTLTGLEVIFDVREGESVYFSFTCYVDVDIETGHRYIYFWFGLNDTKIDNPMMSVYLPKLDDDWDGGVYSITHIPVSLQHYNSTIEPGTYSLTMKITCPHANDICYENTLFVQAFSN